MVDVRHRAAWLNRAVGIVARLAVFTLVLGITSVVTPQAAPASAPAARHAVPPVAPTPTPMPVPAPTPAPANPSCPRDIGTRTVVLLVHGYNSSEATWQDNAFSKLCDSRTYVNTFNYGAPDKGDQDPSLKWVNDQRIGPDLATDIVTLSKISKAQGGSGKVLLVAHSMGGLAIRCALASPCNKMTKPETQELAGNVGTVVTFDTPNLGSFLRTQFMGTDSATADWRAEALTQLCLLAGPALGNAVGGPALGLSVAAVEFLTHYCAHFKAIVNGPAAQAFTPGSLELSKLPSLPVVPVFPVTVPVTAVAGTVQYKTTTFYHDVNLGDLGDLVVDQASAHAQVRPGMSDVALTVDCGGLNISLLDRLARGAAGQVDLLKNGGKIEIPKCTHISETNDDQFLAAAKQAIDKWINDHTPATPTGLTAEPLSSTSVRLSWNDVSSNEDGFKITVNGTPSPDALSSGSTTIEMPGLKAETKYCFTVEAYNSAVKSAPTAQVCATTPKELPLATSVDWTRATYQSTCANETQTERSVTLIPGKAASTPNPDRPAHGATLDFVLAGQAVGDITGDGRPEVAIVLLCHPSDTSPNLVLWEIHVFTDGPSRMGVIILAPDAGFHRVTFVEGQVSLSSNTLSADVNLYAPGDCNACPPSVQRTYNWTWADNQFVRGGS